MIPEATHSDISLYKDRRIHSVVFGGFSPDALKDDPDSGRVVVTADEGQEAVS